jgi:1-acyl-sn-glycerol-3-phosphate acyltransferase
MAGDARASVAAGAMTAATSSGQNPVKASITTGGGNHGCEKARPTDTPVFRCAERDSGIMKTDLVNTSEGTLAGPLGRTAAGDTDRGGLLRRMLPRIVATILFCGFALNTVLCITPMVLIAPIKLLSGRGRLRDMCDRVLNRIAETWIGINNCLLNFLTPTRWVFTGLEGLSPNRWYMLVANHQSWVDILVLQRVFNRRVPFMKFFIKRELLWMPLLGFGWWILDFPFMKRSKPGRHRDRKRQTAGDLDVAMKACDKFKRLPVTVMNFVEGTRFTPKKHHHQKSPFQRLLRPKSGGAAIVFNAMGTQLSGLLDVTIHYPNGAPTVWQLFCGDVPTVRVDVRLLPFSEDLTGDYLNDAAYRRRIQQFFNTLWEAKDRRLAALSGERPASA